MIFHQRGNHTEAVRQIDLALKINPTNIFALNKRGVALKELKRFEEALASYDRALSIQADYAEALLYRGDILRAMRRRGRIARRLANASPCLIGIEAGMATHYVARELLALGHDVRQVLPAYAKPFRQGHKNDLRADIHYGQEHQSSTHGPDTDVQDQSLHRSHRACNTRPAHTDRL